MPDALMQRVEKSIISIADWTVNNKFRGYEPFDGLSSPLARLTFGNLFLERIFQQVVRRVPWNIRPLIGVTKKDSTKGRLKEHK